MQDHALLSWAGLNSASPKPISTSECDYWEVGLLEISFIKFRGTSWMRVSLSPKDWCPCNKRWHGEKKVKWRWRQRLEWCSYEPRNTKKLGERYGTDSLLEHSEEAWPCWPLAVEVRSLQKGKRINFCCVSHSTVWSFIMAALGTQCILSLQNISSESQVSLVRTVWTPWSPDSYILCLCFSEAAVSSPHWPSVPGCWRASRGTDRPKAAKIAFTAPA